MKYLLVFVMVVIGSVVFNNAVVVAEESSNEVQIDEIEIVDYGYLFTQDIENNGKKYFLNRLSGLFDEDGDLLLSVCDQLSLDHKSINVENIYVRAYKATYYMSYDKKVNNNNTIFSYNANKIVPDVYDYTKEAFANASLYNSGLSISKGMYLEVSFSPMLRSNYAEIVDLAYETEMVIEYEDNEYVYPNKIQELYSKAEMMDKVKEYREAMKNNFIYTLDQPILYKMCSFLVDTSIFEEGKYIKIGFRTIKNNKNEYYGINIHFSDEIKWAEVLIDKPDNLPKGFNILLPDNKAKFEFFDLNNL